jgi:hypothetical protein
VIHREWKTLLRSSANNMLIRLPCDGPQANFAVNHCLTVLRRSLLPVGADLVLVRGRNAPSSPREIKTNLVSVRAGKAFELKQVKHFEDDDDNDNDSDNVEDVSVHRSWITCRYAWWRAI